MILRIKKPEDRETVARILFSNGYTVRPTKEKPPGGKTFVGAVEVVEDDRVREGSPEKRDQ